MKPWTLVLALTLVAQGVAPVRAQEAGETAIEDEAQSAADDAAIERLSLRVTLASGRTLTVDRGRSSGIEAGDRVMFFPLGAPAFEGVVRLVEEHRAEVELTSAEPAAEPGLRGEAQVPAARLAARARRREGAQVPEHPPWQRAPEDWDPSQPLLAPVKSPAPEERPSELRGRAYTLFDFIDDGQGAGREYMRSRSGLDFAWDNPFGQGGRLTFDGEYSYRHSESDGESDTDSIARIERLSYAIGGQRGRPHRVEVGRFLSHEFPELGVVDGVEYAFRTSGGHRIGASLGYLPERFDRMDSGDDLAAAVFFRFVSDESERVALGGAYQKTWHQGTADRDLFLTTADWRIAERTTFRGAAWVDLYGSEEAFKESGAELTQLHARIDQRFSKAGLGLFAARTRWPDLLRDELPPTTATGILDHEVTRLGVDGWGRVSEHLRLGARIEAWEDEIDDGGAAELRVGLPDLLWERGTLDLSVFATQGRFSDVIGGRVSAQRWFGQHALRLSYELRDFDQQGFLGEQSTLLHQLVRASLDLAFGRDWDFSVEVDTRFGDEQDSLGILLYLQRRF